MAKQKKISASKVAAKKTPSPKSAWGSATQNLPSSFLGFLSSSQSEETKSPLEPTGRLFVVGLDGKSKGNPEAVRLQVLASLITKECLPSYLSRIQTELAEGKESLHFPTEKGPVWVVARKGKPARVSHDGRLEESDYSWFRDRVGHWMTSVRNLKGQVISLQFESCGEASILGSFVGIELAAYQYKATLQASGHEALPTLLWKSSKGLENLVNQARAIGLGANTTRHLVNAPPNHLNPATFAEVALEIFNKYPSVEVDIWDKDRLVKEKMNLLLAVGAGAEHAPRMVHIKYRPGKGTSIAKTASRPVALVGKGITFDSGGLDIKPSSGMRLMKKDMGGAGAVIGVALWAAETQYRGPLDFYLALAENSVDERSFRPSDVIVARNGLAVEIHNTDAEGRLVLADVLDVAVKQTGDSSPEAVINVATLTGAIKVALGADIGGLFSNHDPLALQLQQAAQEGGDLLWRMPLYSKYTQSFSSNFADLVNAVDGFGGPITAALFLEKFVDQKPWAHLDIYAWADRAENAFSSTGGNGQAVQCLITFLQSRTGRAQGR